jgi:hypothetical protein
MTEIQQLHRAVIMDRMGKPVMLVLLCKAGRAGVLVANLLTERRDHVRRIIEDDLFLEFAVEDAPAVASIAHTLITSEAEELREMFLGYAEKLIAEHVAGQAPELSALNVPSTGLSALKGRPGKERRIAMRSTPGNCRDAAAELLKLAAHTTDYEPWLFVSTADIEEKLLSTCAQPYKRFVALVDLPGFPTKLVLTMVKKKLIVLWTVVCLMALIALFPAWKWGWNNWPRATEKSKKATEGGEKGDHRGNAAKPAGSTKS